MNDKDLLNIYILNKNINPEDVRNPTLKQILLVYKEINRQQILITNIDSSNWNDSYSDDRGWGDSYSDDRGW